MKPLIKLLSKRTAIRIASIIMTIIIGTAASKLAIYIDSGWIVLFMTVITIWLFIAVIPLFVAEYYIDKHYKTIDEQMYDLGINNYSELFYNYWDQYDFDIKVWNSLTIMPKIEWWMCILLAMNDSSYLLDQSDEFKIDLINFIMK